MTSKKEFLDKNFVKVEMTERAVKCSNCDKFLCKLQYEEMYFKFENFVIVKCPFCGDESFQTKVDTERFEVLPVEHYELDRVESDIEEDKNIKSYVYLVEQE